MMKRSDCEGPDYFSMDLSVYKNLPFGERFNAQLRFEMFNIFNTVNLRADGVNTAFDVPVTLDGLKFSF